MASKEVGPHNARSYTSIRGARIFTVSTWKTGLKREYKRELYRIANTILYKGAFRDIEASRIGTREMSEKTSFTWYRESRPMRRFLENYVGFTRKYLTAKHMVGGAAEVFNDTLNLIHYVFVRSRRKRQAAQADQAGLLLLLGSSPESQNRAEPSEPEPQENHRDG